MVNSEHHRQPHPHPRTPDTCMRSPSLGSVALRGVLCPCLPWEHQPPGGACVPHQGPVFSSFPTHRRSTAMPVPGEGPQGGPGWNCDVAGGHLQTKHVITSVAPCGQGRKLSACTSDSWRVPRAVVHFAREVQRHRGCLLLQRSPPCADEYTCSEHLHLSLWAPPSLRSSPSPCWASASFPGTQLSRGTLSHSVTAMCLHVCLLRTASCRPYLSLWPLCVFRDVWGRMNEALQREKNYVMQITAC